MQSPNIKIMIDLNFFDGLFEFQFLHAVGVQRQREARPPIGAVSAPRAQEPDSEDLVPERLVNEVAHDVEDPQTGVSVWERAQARRATPPITSQGRAERMMSSFSRLPSSQLSKPC